MNNLMMSASNASMWSLFGRQSAETTQRIEQQSDAFYNNAPVHLAGVSDFIERSKQRVLDFTIGETAQKIQAVYNKAASIFQPDRVQPLSYIEDIQQATLVMQRFIMAEPTVRTQYLSGMCNGYEDSYVNMHGKAIAESHYDYRVGTQGMVQTMEVDEVTETKAVTYFESQKEDYLLSFNDRVEIRTSMLSVAKMMEAAVNDPTCVYNSLL